MTPRRWAALASLAAASSAYAHGERLLVPCFGVILVLPGIALLLLPWHQWWARLTSAAVLLGLTLLYWFVVVPRMRWEPTSTIGEWFYS